MRLSYLAAAFGLAAAAGAANAAVTTIDFNDFTAPGFTGDFTVFDGAGSPGNAATVNGSPFLAVPSQASPSGTATYTARGAITAFGFDWGTPDGYNTLTFRDAGGAVVASYTGAGAPARFEVAFTAAQNVRTVAFGSSSKAFEIDNVSATGAVPEPATWGLMLAGFGLVGVAARRRATAVSA